METIIRKAKAEDLRAVQDLNHALFESDSSSDDTLNLNWPYEDGEEYFRRMIAGETGVCYVAEVNDEIVGYLAGSIKLEQPSYSTVRRSELENMFVKEEFRSQGIGEKLAKTFLQWSKSSGVAKSFVQAYAPNQRAIAFYQRAGFAPYSVELEIDLG
jgi:GNAT superfamily N-acetyltransferase